MNHGVTPEASRPPIIEPALVPTMYSASAGSQPVSRAIASRPPVSQAPPMTPPAPSTRPTRGPFLLTRRSVRRCFWLVAFLLVVRLLRVVARGALVGRFAVELVLVRDVRVAMLRLFVPFGS